MKAPQVVALVALVVGGVFGLTFLKQYSRKPVERSVSKDVQPRSEPLYVPEKVAGWEVAKLDPLAAAPKYEFGEFEKDTKGQYDFWVLNRNAAPVAVRLLGQSCTCFEMSLGIVPARELTVARAEAQSRMAVLAAALGLVGAPELAVLGSVPDVAKGIQWRPLTQQHERQQAVLNVPPADPTTGPQIAAVRFSWVVRSPQPIRLKATVQHQLESNLETTDFEVPLSIVSRMMVAPSLLQLGDLNYKEQREVHFFVWSATRPSLDVRIESVSPDECIEVGTPVPLPEQVLSELPQVMLQAGAITQLTRLQCGYTVKVTVHERRGDKHQLELGPLGRRLVVKLNNGSPDDDVNVILTGVVRGAIRVGDASDRDRIDLGTFPARRGVDKRVTITSTDTGINLKVVGKSPEALQVELKEQPAGVGQKRWLLHVEVAPNTFSGMLPSDTAVYLQTDANPPRSIRIPVVGVATH